MHMKKKIKLYQKKALFHRSHENCNFLGELRDDEKELREFLFSFCKILKRRNDKDKKNGYIRYFRS
jgi:hypothetical protein